MINHDNFDMYCMRCADGDLSPAELKAFHAYIASHPDLKAEWEIWQQLKMPADAAPMPNKDQLLRKEPARLEEEQAWLLIDGELSANEQNAVHQLIADNQAANLLVNHLRQFVLIPPTIACPDKQKLLRSTQQPRVIWMQRVVRFTAAAAIVALLLQVAITRRTDSSLPASTPESTTFSNPTPIPSNRMSDKLAEVDDATIPTTADEKSRDAKDYPLTTASAIENLPTTPQTLSTVQEIPPVVTSNTLVANDPTVSKIVPPAEKIDIAAVLKPEDESRLSGTLAKQVIYRELDTESDRTTITIGTVELREGKIRGVWRKLGALLKSPDQQNSSGSNSSSISTQQPL